MRPKTPPPNGNADRNVSGPSCACGVRDLHSLEKAQRGQHEPSPTQASMEQSTGKPTALSTTPFQSLPRRTLSDAVCSRLAVPLFTQRRHCVESLQTRCLSVASGGGTDLVLVDTRQPITVKVDEPAVAFLPPLCLHNATLDLDWSFRLRIT